MMLLGRKLAVAGLLLALLFLLAAPQAHAQGEVHVVQPGETLSAIAARYGTTPQALAAANGLANANYIYVGQRLTIASGATAGGSAGGGNYTVQRGDTLSAIAARHGTSVEALARANGLRSANTIYAGQRLTIPTGGAAPAVPASGSGQVYTVRAGDTLAAIAARLGSTPSAIAGANGLANANLIYPGQQLRVPAAGRAQQAAPAGAGKRIVVDLSAQQMAVYQDGQLLWSWTVSTGRPGQETAVGHYRVLNKIPNAYAYTWSLQMPYWLGIYWAGSLQNGIHALPIMANGQRLWDGYLGQRVSYGCVILSTQNAATLYAWADVGTPVDIVW